MISNFSRNCFYLERMVYTRKKLPWEEKAKKKKKNALFNTCFLGPSYVQGRVISQDSILKKNIIT